MRFHQCYMHQLVLPIYIDARAHIRPLNHVTLSSGAFDER